MLYPAPPPKLSSTSEFGTTRASPAKWRSSVKFIPDSNQRYRRPVSSKGFADAAGASPARASPGTPAAASVAHETSQSTRTHLIRAPFARVPVNPAPAPTVGLAGAGGRPARRDRRRARHHLSSPRSPAPPV